MSVERLIERKEVVICAGAGGVGKTTTSAAIAAGMAQRGKKVAVLTVDPAKRSPTRWGLPELGNEERRVDPARLRAAGLGGEGELWAMMLDAKRTFDDLIDAHAPDAESRDAVLSNPIYREISNAVAGSQEYMAMEKLHELHQEGSYDPLVLDTPPTRNASSSWTRPHACPASSTRARSSSSGRARARGSVWWGREPRCSSRS
ncbi:MAG: ArsA family ATPase [Thermoleophilaceae bacterium]